MTDDMSYVPVADRLNREVNLLDLLQNFTNKEIENGTTPADLIMAISDVVSFGVAYILFASEKDPTDGTTMLAAASMYASMLAANREAIFAKHKAQIEAESATKQ